MMDSIKFSHDYQKLPEHWENTTALIIAVTWIDDMRAFKKAHPAVIAYDTRFRNEDGHYELDFDQGLVIVMFHEATGVPFATFRRYTPEKWVHYTNLRGETVILERVTT